MRRDQIADRIRERIRDAGTLAWERGEIWMAVFDYVGMHVRDGVWNIVQVVGQSRDRVWDEEINA